MDSKVTQDRLDIEAAGLGAGLEGDDFGCGGVTHGPHYMHACTVIASTNAQPANPVPVLSARMVDGASEAREFMRRAVRETGLTPYALAKKAGVAPSTITRPLNDPEFKFVPKQSTLTKIALAAGLTAPKVGEPSLTVEVVSQWVPLVGEVRAGAWTEIRDEPEIEERLPVHLPEYQGASLFAVRVAGRSMDRKYQEGTVVIAVPAAEAGIRVGDDVIVRRRHNGLAETTLKEVAREPDGTYSLRPCSTDDTFKPILMGRNADCQEGAEIIGVVIYSINPRRAGRGPLVVFAE